METTRKTPVLRWLSPSALSPTPGLPLSVLPGVPRTQGTPNLITHKTLSGLLLYSLASSYPSPQGNTVKAPTPFETRQKLQALSWALLPSPGSRESPGFLCFLPGASLTQGRLSQVPAPPKAPAHLYRHRVPSLTALPTSVISQLFVWLIKESIISNKP